MIHTDKNRHLAFIVDKIGHVERFILLFAFCLLWLIYAQAMTHDFVGLDDNLYVTANQYTQMGLTWESVRWAFTNIYAFNWQPITWLSHMLDVELFGLSASKHHLVNILLHTLNTGLLFAVLRCVSLRPVLSAWVALLFAIHPLHVESVAWIAERKDVLSTFFGLLALWGYAYYVQSQKIIWYALSFLMLALGLMSKAMLVTWPFIFLLLDFWPLQRMTPWRTLLLEKIPFFILVIIFSGATIIAQGDAVVAVEHYEIMARLENSLLAYAMYLYKTVLPYNLAVFYPHASIRSATWVIGVVLFSLLALSSWVVINRQRASYLLVGWAWFIGTLVPVIGIVQAGKQFTADRYMYIPQIGLAIMLVWGLDDLIRQKRLKKSFVVVSALSIVCLLSFVAWKQVGYWRNDIALFRHAVAVVPNNNMAHTLLGIAYFKRGQEQQAAGHFLEALRISPQHYAYTYLAKIAENQRQLNVAIDAYQHALQLVPVNRLNERVNILENLAILFFSQQQWRQAKRCFQEIIQLQPEHAVAQHHMMLLKRLNHDHDDNNN